MTSSDEEPICLEASPQEQQQQQQRRTKRDITFNIVNSMTGTSTIAIPLIAFKLGIPTTMVFMILIAFEGIIADHILAHHQQHSKARTYEELLEKHCGKTAGILAALSIIANAQGKILVWFIILTDILLGNPPQSHGGLIVDFLSWFFHGNEREIDFSAWYMHRSTWIVVLYFTSLPVISLRSLHKVAIISKYKDLSVLIIMLLSISLSCIAIIRHKGCMIPIAPTFYHRDEKNAQHISVIFNAVASIPILLSTMFSQHAVLSIAQEMHPFDQKTLDSTVAIATALVGVGKFSLATSNVIIFGSNLKSDCLLNYTKNSRLSEIISPSITLLISSSIKVLFLIDGLFSLPIFLQPFQENLWSLARKHIRGWHSPAHESRSTFLLINYCVVALSAALGALVPDISIPLTVLGATAVGYLAFMGPALLMLQEEKELSLSQVGYSVVENHAHPGVIDHGGRGEVNHQGDALNFVPKSKYGSHMLAKVMICVGIAQSLLGLIKTILSLF